MKKCPYCAEEIQNEAVKCKHCGSVLGGQTPPIASGKVPFYRRKSTIIGCIIGAICYVLLSLINRDNGHLVPFVAFVFSGGIVGSLGPSAGKTWKLYGHHLRSKKAAALAIAISLLILGILFVPRILSDAYPYLGLGATREDIALWMKDHGGSLGTPYPKGRVDYEYSEKRDGKMEHSGVVIFFQGDTANSLMYEGKIVNDREALRFVNQWESEGYTRDGSSDSQNLIYVRRTFDTLANIYYTHGYMLKGDDPGTKFRGEENEWSLAELVLHTNGDLKDIRQAHIRGLKGYRTTINEERLPETRSVKSDSIGMEFVLVQPGTFQMGSDDGDADEKPKHSVTISKPFYMSKYEVTQQQWREVMGANSVEFQADNRPVEAFSWDDAQLFIRKLNEKEGSTKYRMPTEAEWEFAARGGTKSHGFKFAGSDNVADVAVYLDNSGGGTYPIGTKRPNELGLYDMSGNAFEWCSDWYGSYSSTSQTDPKGPTSGKWHVLRGGSFGYGAGVCSVTFRNVYQLAYNRGFVMGIRCVRDVD